MAGQFGKIVKHPSEPNPGLKANESPCIVYLKFGSVYCLLSSPTHIADVIYGRPLPPGGVLIRRQRPHRRQKGRSEADKAWLPDGSSQIFRSYVFGPSGFWTMAPLRCPAKLDPFLSLDCAPTPSTLAQSKERKGSNFAIWQPCDKASRQVPAPVHHAPDRRGRQGSEPKSKKDQRRQDVQADGVSRQGS